MAQVSRKAVREQNSSDEEAIFAQVRTCNEVLAALKESLGQELIVQDVNELIEVAAAIIEDESGKVLIARRAKGKSQEGMWEFPGGKLEPGESAEQCLRRELLEEMGIEIEPYAYFGVNGHDYGNVSIRLIAYKAKFVRGEVALTDHDDFCWVRAEEFGQYEFAPADVKFLEMLASDR